jgi:hypothetical protein
MPSRLDCENENKIAVNRNGKIHCRKRTTSRGPRSRLRASRQKTSDELSIDEFMNRLTIPDLIRYAKARSLGGYSGLNKAALIKHIKKNIDLETGKLKR